MNHTATPLPIMRVTGPKLEYALPRLKKIEDSKNFSNFGAQEVELRDRFSEFLKIDANRIATASSATIGLMGAVSTTNIQNWLSPSYTFPATPASILTAGKNLVFGEIDNGWWLKPEEKKKHAIMPTAPFGAKIDFLRWQHYNNIIFDAAASLGAQTPQWEHMKEDWVVVYSLHATKILGSGEGSVLVFGSPEKAIEFRSWTNFGFSGNRNSDIVGINGKMSEIQAAFAHSALDGWALEKSEWHEARKLTLFAEKQLPVEGLPWSGEGPNPYWVVSFSSTEEVNAIEIALKKAMIESRRWWGLGCHKMPAYSKIPHVDLTQSDLIASKSLGLPIFRGISEADITRVIEVVLKTLKN